MRTPAPSSTSFMVAARSWPIWADPVGRSRESLIARLAKRSGESPFNRRAEAAASLPDTTKSKGRQHGSRGKVAVEHGRQRADAGLQPRLKVESVKRRTERRRTSCWSCRQERQRSLL